MGASISRAGRCDKIDAVRRTHAVQVNNGAIEPHAQASASTALRGDWRPADIILSEVPNNGTDDGSGDIVCAFRFDARPLNRHSHVSGPGKRLTDRTAIVRQRPMSGPVFIRFWLLMGMSVAMRM